MKALLCQNFGTPESLILIETNSPIITETQVLISVKACGVNFPDNLIIQGKYQFKPELPFAPGGEVAGVIIAVGNKVNKLVVGMRVLALCGWGGFAEEVAVESNRVFQIPDQMDFISASGTLYNYGTSYYALKQKAGIKPGETILILGAAGGVGLAAIELAKLMGATVIACASSDEKLQVCKSKGADFIINYQQADLKKLIAEITNNKGVDIVYDPIGGPISEIALRSMAWNGRYLVIGFASGIIPQFPVNIALLKGCSIIGVFWGSFAEKEFAANTQNMAELIQWFSSGKIKQHIYKIYSLENASEALTGLLNRTVIGKAIVKIGNWEEQVLETPTFENLKDYHSEKAIENLPVVFKNKSVLKNFIGKNLGTTDWLTITQ